MRPSRRAQAAGWIATILAAICVLPGCFEQTTAERDGSREEAPAFELPQLDGAPLSLEAMRGKIVILDFWATWCAPCEVQMPVLDALWQDVDWRDAHQDDLMIVGISVDTDPPAAVAAWVEERGFRYPIALGDQDLAMRYGVFGFPTLVVIDPAGGIYTRHTGVWSRPEIEEVLDRIRAERPTDA